MANDNTIKGRMSHLFRLDVSPEPWLVEAWLSLTYLQSLGTDIQEALISIDNEVINHE